MYEPCMALLDWDAENWHVGANVICNLRRNLLGERGNSDV